MDIPEPNHSLRTPALPRSRDTLVPHLTLHLLPLKLRILLLQMPLNPDRRDRCDDARTAHDRPTRIIPRLLAIREHVAGVKMRDARAHEVHNRQRRRALRPGPRQRRGQPRHAQIVRRVRARRHQEHREVPRAGAGGKHGEQVAEEGHGHAGRDVEAALAALRRVQRDDHGGYESEEVGRGGEEEGDGAGVAEGADDGREEVVERLRRDEGHLLESEGVQLRVEQRLLQAPQHAFRVFVRDAGVLLADAVLGERLVGGGEPAVGGLERVVGQDGDDEERDDDGHGAFDDEEPFPGWAAGFTFHSGCDCALEVSGNRSEGIEQSLGG